MAGQELGSTKTKVKLPSQSDAQAAQKKEEDELRKLIERSRLVAQTNREIDKRERMFKLGANNLERAERLR